MPEQLQQRPVFAEQTVIEHPSLRNRLLRSRIGRAAMASLAGLGIAGSLAATESSPAYADADHTYTVTGTGGEGVWLHGDPGLGDKGDLITVIPEGATVDADCYVNDTPVGERNNPAWLHITWKGDAGFVTDYYTDSEWSGDNTLHDQGLAFCGEDKQQIATQEHEPKLLNPDFNRLSGANWALGNARDPQENGIQCTWFVSNALWHAGLPKSKVWSDEGGYWSRGQHFDGTVTAHAAPKLIEYLRKNFSVTWQDLGSINNYNIPLAEVGDIIAYSWDGDGISITWHLLLVMLKRIRTIRLLPNGDSLIGVG